MLITARYRPCAPLSCQCSARRPTPPFPTGINILHIEPTVEKLLELAVLLRSTSAG